MLASVSAPPILKDCLVSVAHFHVLFYAHFHVLFYVAFIFVIELASLLNSC